MMKNSQSIIALNLLKIREYTGYTVERLAELIGVDKELIEQWEAGVKEPTLSQGLLLSRLYGVPVDDIFCDCKTVEILTESKREEFNHDAWLNRIANRRYCW